MAERVPLADVENFQSIFHRSEPRTAFSDGVAKKILAEVSRLRYQYLGGLFFATILPVFLRYGLDAPANTSASFTNSLVASYLAFSIGFVFYRKLTAYPGVRAAAYILPAFVAAYGLMAILFLVLRLDYSRFQILCSFIMVVGWYLVTFFLTRRVHRTKLSIVPFGGAARLQKLPHAEWQMLDETALTSNDRTPIVADLRATLPPEWENFLADAALNGRQVFHFKQIEESLSGRVDVEHLSENPIGSVVPGIVYASAKRYIDVFLAITALVFLSPLLAAMALAIRLESPGPAIYRQQRIGVGGQPFTMIKFRSMRELPAGEKETLQQQLMHDERRVTRLGRFIRRTRIDELPQLFNILRGEMSWIGPRPESIPLVETYQDAIPFYKYRHIVRPGITGWAQVNQGHVTGVSDAITKLQYDFFYVKHFSVWLDILVVFRTLRVILTGSGAR